MSMPLEDLENLAKVAQRHAMEITSRQVQFLHQLAQKEVNEDYANEDSQQESTQLVPKLRKKRGRKVLDPQVKHQRKLVRDREIAMKNRRKKQDEVQLLKDRIQELEKLVKKLTKERDDALKRLN